MRPHEGPEGLHLLARTGSSSYFQVWQASTMEIVPATMIAATLIVACNPLDLRRFSPRREDKERFTWNSDYFFYMSVPGLLADGPRRRRSCSAGSAGYGPERHRPVHGDAGHAPGPAYGARGRRVNEFGGGLLLALGLLMPLAALMIASTMLVASLTAHRGKGPWNTESGWELPLLYGLIPVALTFHGAGQWSLDHALGWGAELSGLGWGLGAIALAVLGAIDASWAPRRSPASVATGTACRPPVSSRPQRARPTDEQGAPSGAPFVRLSPARAWCSTWAAAAARGGRRPSTRISCISCENHQR